MGSPSSKPVPVLTESEIDFDFIDVETGLVVVEDTDPKYAVGEIPVK